MPGKKKVGGKPKPSKAAAERKRLQREEDEKRLREEEELRLQAEKEEQERLEREKKEQEELQRLEFKDQERREDELNEVRHLLEENQTALTKWKTDKREKAKWERYMLCDGRPDPSHTQEVNTYISLWREQPQDNTTPVLQQCALALQLVEELQEVLKEVHSGGEEASEQQRLQEQIVCLQELIHHKHLLITQEVLNNASSNSDIDTGNMQTVVTHDNITMCVWANLNKNPRFKGFYFEEAGLGFEIPKQLAVSDIAVRILHTRYDHLSPQARLALHGGWMPSRRTLREDEVPCPETASPDQGEVGGSGEGGGGGGDKDFKEDSESPTGLVGSEEEVRSLRGSVRRKSAVSVLSMRSNRYKRIKDIESQIQTQMEADLSEVEPGAGPEADVGCDGDAVVDLFQYTPLGGVFYCDLFRLPPQASQVNGWEIRQLLATGLDRFPYPGECCQTAGSAPSEPEDSGVITCCTPVGLSITVPESILLLEPPRVARWNATDKQWRLDGISDVSYEAGEARLTLKMDAFHALVLLQDTYANLPFQDWTLCPLGQDSVLFSVNAALIHLSITIQGDQCMLQTEKEGTLAQLQGRWMSSLGLQEAMASAGLNIFVNEHADRYVSACGKDPLREHTAYQQMALLASACAFSWSRWNAACGSEHMVLQACEHPGPAPIPRDLWSLYLLGAQRSQKLRMTERSEAFSPEHHPDTEFHSTFVHTLHNHMTPEGVAKTLESNFLFVDTVQSLLCATRPLNFS